MDKLHRRTVQTDCRPPGPWKQLEQRARRPRAEDNEPVPPWQREGCSRRRRAKRALRWEEGPDDCAECCERDQPARNADAKLQEKALRRGVQGRARRDWPGMRRMRA